MTNGKLEYVGFWARSGAATFDAVLQLLITAALVYVIYGKFVADEGYFLGRADRFIQLVLPFWIYIFMWMKFGATPGKMAIGALIIDADTGMPITFGQAVLRYLCLILSVLSLGLGIFWIGFDSRKQGWHDKLANTVVVRPVYSTEVHFRG